MELFRKLLRRSFYAAAAVSSLLLLATLILWPVSYFRRAEITNIAGADNVYWVGCQSGRAYVIDWASFILETRTFHLTFSPFTPTRENRWSYFTWYKPTQSSYIAIQEIEGPRTSLGILWFSHAQGFPCRNLYIPCSYLALLFSILPVLAVGSIRRRRKLARVGRCGKCGYDLRAHAAGGRCPECGTPIDKAVQPSCGGEVPAA